MDGLIPVVLGALERGMIFALLVLSVYTTSRIMKFDDLSLEGSFSLGAALGALALGWGWNPVLALAFALVGGMLVGCTTAAIHCGLGLSMLISGIVVTSGLFSIVLMMAGSNISLIGVKTCFSWFSGLGSLKHLVVIAACAALLYALVYHPVASLALWRYVACRRFKCASCWGAWTARVDLQNGCSYYLEWTDRFCWGAVRSICWLFLHLDERWHFGCSSYGFDDCRTYFCSLGAHSFGCRFCCLSTLAFGCV